MSKLAEIKEYLERLQAMANDDGETWDLSPNDRIAIRGILQRCEELEKGLRELIKCPTCEGTGEYVFECNGCLAGPPVPHEQWCGTPDKCPQCDGKGISADDPEALAEAERLLKGGE